MTMRYKMAVFKDGVSFVLLLVLFYCCWHQWSALGFPSIILLFQTAAEVGLGDEIITNWEEKCFRPHSIWIVAWSWFLPVTSLFNVGQFNSCQFWAE
ncbi:uncharacterized protein LOC114266811 isoform X5 [Camellia sinensis]|uniref:uncharacterized protein LOC114266811 isoform X5 n=1 Tax=Camellia sinensis TaxID=4442 RepID=UPI001036203F|nr:uncharacterized protein LOC114266811 isoform X5 [Camellia sinensis]